MLEILLSSFHFLIFEILRWRFQISKYSHSHISQNVLKFDKNDVYEYVTKWNVTMKIIIKVW